jgi:hypothetical protein
MFGQGSLELRGSRILSKKFAKVLFFGFVSGHDFPPRRMPQSAQNQMGFSP